MNIIFFSDGHGTLTNAVARTDEVGQTFFRKLGYIFKKARETESIIVTAGDLGDKPREWYFLSEFARFLRKNKDVKLYTIYGQHDAYLYNESTKHATTLGVLARLRMLTILNDQPFRPADNIAIYGSSWGAEIPEAVDEPYYANGSVFNVLMIHKDISNAPLWPGHEYTQAKTFLRRQDTFDGIVCGDIHRSFYYMDSVGRWITNTGPLMRLEASEYNFEHEPFVYRFDTEARSLHKIRIPHAPAEEILSREHIEIQTTTTQMLEEFVQTIETDSVEHVNIYENLLTLLENVDNDVRAEAEDIVSNVGE
ncbi:MAG: hypothetical protein DRJ03_00995 [Chloroflexi bacterium]|nr:MAG: hypothetical protein DRJ03_00995 [Chloroflexota bacterium]